MGKYINEMPNGTRLPATGKAIWLEQIPGAKKIAEPTDWEEGIVCVVSNGAFEAAGYAFDEKELNEFKRFDGRPRTWLKIPNAKTLAK